MPTVAVLVPTLASGGAEAVAVTLANELTGHGVTVDLVVGDATGPRRNDVSESVRIRALGTTRMYRSVPGLVRYLRRHRPAGAVAILDQANLAVLAARRAARVSSRVVCTTHNLMTPAVRRMAWGRRSVFLGAVRCSYPWADALVAPSAAVAADLEAILSRPGTVAVVPNPIDVEGIRATADDARQARLDRDAPVVLAAGRLVEVKDFSLLLRAFALVGRERRARLVIAGEGPLRSDLISLAHQLGIGGSVEFPGYTPDLPLRLATADVAVSTAQEEGFGNFLVEALAAGIPVVAVAGDGAIGEVLEGGRLGSLVTRREPSALADALRHALEHPTPPVSLDRLEQFMPAAVARRYASLLLGDGP